jgi:hypothetical protein
MSALLPFDKEGAQRHGVSLPLFDSLMRLGAADVHSSVATPATPDATCAKLSAMKPENKSTMQSLTRLLCNDDRRKFTNASRRRQHPHSCHCASSARFPEQEDKVRRSCRLMPALPELNHDLKSWSSPALSSTTTKHETKPRNEAFANVTFYFSDISPQQDSARWQTGEMKSGGRPSPSGDVVPHAVGDPPFSAVPHWRLVKRSWTGLSSLDWGADAGRQ